MGCNLDKFTTYDVGRVVHDNDTGSYSAQLISPPASCPDKVFNSKKAELRVVSGYTTLTFDQSKRRPVITVPRKEYVEQIGDTGHGVVFWSLIIFAICAVVGVYLIYRKQEEDAEEERREARREREAAESRKQIRRSDTIYAEPRAREESEPRTKEEATAQTQAKPQVVVQTVSAPPQTIVHNHGSSNDGLVTGIILGEMMAGGNHHTHTEHIVEREIIREEPRHESHSSRYESDDDNSKSSSYSSDSSSSSSYDSDSSSSSSYSSDSSSSFSSDSGGSSFGSDD